MQTKLVETKMYWLLGNLIGDFKAGRSEEILDVQVKKKLIVFSSFAIFLLKE